MIVLGIETSCDETAAAVVNDKREILSNEVFSQVSQHRPYGGVVPEIAARAHIEHLGGMVRAAMQKAQMSFAKLDAIAVAGGPGLIGGVLVGVMFAKAIAGSRQLPFVAVNHLEGHALSARLDAKPGNDVEFPYLLLLVSGGHCQLLAVEGVDKYRRLGTTLDDALGEAFDKTAKMLGLPYPGGPEVEKAAKNGDERRFKLPRPMKGRPGCHFSFSGLKTAVRHVINDLPEDNLTNQDVADISASFQAAAADALVGRTANAFGIFKELYAKPTALVVGGGVAANQYLRDSLETLSAKEGVALIAPAKHLCTDNAAMIAWAGIERLQLGLVDGMDFAPRPRWPLDPDAPVAAFAGVKA